MSDDKDRLAEQLRQREKADEDHFFAEQSRKQIEKLRASRAQSAASGQATCPRCGTPLEITHMKGVAVDGCPQGHGLWLDKSELDLIAKREGDSWLARLLLGSPS
jgi:DNA repair exonuclease SbcCD ATPase subunit